MALAPMAIHRSEDRISRSDASSPPVARRRRTSAVTTSAAPIASEPSRKVVAKKRAGVAHEFQAGTVGSMYTIDITAIRASPTSAAGPASPCRQRGVSHLNHWQKAKAPPTAAKRSEERR